MIEQCKHFIEEWLVENYSRRDIFFELDECWDVLSNQEVEPMQVIHIFDELKNRNMISHTFTLQFYSVAKQNSPEMEYVMSVLQYNDTLYSQPFVQFTNNGCWDKKKTLDFFAKVLSFNASGEEQNPVNQENLDPEDHLTNESADEETEQRILSTALPKDRQIHFQPLLIGGEDEMEKNLEQSERHSFTFYPDSSITDPDPSRSIHPHQDISAQLEHVIHQLETGIELSARIYLKQGDIKELMRILLEVQNELCEIKNSLDNEMKQEA
ncbi:hypothetical protein [Thermoflavimicrobium dichotomicum]|uniref:Uncharacterized protein n=1 Tax=Thermoflavimicrobium dichotomicum TaxID=46223 RepID=A0A1I3R9W0_9BACL|nr:hypothetical protein [Thermoflavimicrobium dichotomicum]SFJ42840.1 hypothetical protein SAMN05421852_10983 [Thermoflavimicrobium dichotomicum]